MRLHPLKLLGNKHRLAGPALLVLSPNPCQRLHGCSTQLGAAPPSVLAVQIYFAEQASTLRMDAFILHDHLSQEEADNNNAQRSGVILLLSLTSVASTAFGQLTTKNPSKNPSGTRQRHIAEPLLQKQC